MRLTACAAVVVRSRRGRERRRGRRAVVREQPAVDEGGHDGVPVDRGAVGEVGLEAGRGQRPACAASANSRSKRSR
jgi:hypothetical protein